MNEIPVLNKKSLPARNKSFFFRAFSHLLSPYNFFELIRYKIGLLRGRSIDIDWDKRVAELGQYSVIDNTHPPDEYDYVTVKQKEIIYPHFLAQLNGTEKSVLDFGCGPGRFTADLALLINGNAIGVDSTKKLIDLCQAKQNVDFIHSKNFFNEKNTSSFDVIWICTVLGGFSNQKLNDLAPQIYQSLNNDGLLFIIELTGKNHIEDAWRTRTISDINAFFPEIQLLCVGSYIDAGKVYSILAGRKPNLRQLTSAE